MTYTVYVLRSRTTERLYTGQTSDLERRLSEHNSPAHNVRKFTSRNEGPCELLRSEPYGTRAEAMRRERFLKSGQGRAWLHQQQGRASPPEAD